MYEESKQKLKGSRGTQRKHGQSFKLNNAHRNADQSETFQLGQQIFRVKVWHHLNFKKLATLFLTLFKIEFLKPDGTLLYKRPMWLFVQAAESGSLSDPYRMYVWRFAIEHLFRFIKQHMGLNSNCSPNLASAQQWMWFCALAYWQLLIIRGQMNEVRLA